VIWAAPLLVVGAGLLAGEAESWRGFLVGFGADVGAWEVPLFTGGVAAAAGEEAAPPRCFLWSRVAMARRGCWRGDLVANWDRGLLGEEEKGELGRLLSAAMVEAGLREWWYL
jgi:hypothetical protein